MKKKTSIVNLINFRYERPSLISAEDSGVIVNGSTTTGDISIRYHGNHRRSSFDSGAEAYSGESSGSGPDSDERPMKSRSRASHQNKSRKGSESQSSVTKKLDPLYEKNNLTKSPYYSRQTSVPDTSRSRHSSNELKLPHPGTMNGSSIRSNSSLGMGKRTLSFSNLSSRFSESSRTNNNHSSLSNRNNILPSKNMGLHRVRSDQNIYSKYSTQGGGVPARTGNNSRARQRLSSQGSNRGHGIGQSKSNPNFQSLSLVENNNHRNIENGRGTRDDVFEDVCEKDQRIMDWLIGIENEAEIPETPEILHEEPTQTDTAIHIVYDDN